MRVQLEQTPQKSGRPSDSVGLRQLTARASISASVYLPAPLRAGEDERVRKPLRANALAEVRYGLRIAEKILEAHGLSLEHQAVSGGTSVRRALCYFDQRFQNISAARKTRASSVVRTFSQSVKTRSASRTNP